MSSSTTYYVTFKVSSGDRFEFTNRDIEYGMLVENDMGFERNKSVTSDK